MYVCFPEIFSMFLNNILDCGSFIKSNEHILKFKIGFQYILRILGIISYLLVNTNTSLCLKVFTFPLRLLWPHVALIVLNLFICFSRKPLNTYIELILSVLIQADQDAALTKKYDWAQIKFCWKLLHYQIRVQINAFIFSQC